MGDVSEGQTIKILLLVFPVGPQGGTIRRLRIWLRAMPSRMHVDLLFYDHPGQDVMEMLSKIAGQGCTLKRLKLPLLKGRLAPLAVVPKVIWTLLGEKHPVVLSASIGADVSAWLSVRAVNLILRRSVRQVAYITGSPVPPPHSGTLRWTLYRGIARVVYPRIDKVVVISTRLKQLMVEEYEVSPERVKVIPISVECPSSERSESKKRIGKGTVFGVVSRLVALKSVEHIIQALAKVLREGYDVRLEVFGAGQQLDSLRALSSRLGLDGEVEFHGWLDEPGEAYRDMDCLVMASRYEGTPRSILEAGCFGVPTIASRVGGVPDVIEHDKTGWMYTYGDIEELSALMRRVADSRHELTQAGQAVRSQVITERTVDGEISAIVRSLFPDEGDATR